MARPRDQEESDLYETEDVEGEFVELDLQEVATLAAAPSYKESNLVFEADSHPEKKFRFWINTPMGFREVDRIYVRLSDTVPEQEIDGPIN